MKTLAQLREQHPKATLYVGRELTKMHEEMLTGSPEKIESLLAKDPLHQKGEFVIIFGPYRK